MKSLFAIMVLALSFNVFAGAEEHAQAEACYYIVLEESSPLNDRVPTSFCLETINVDLSAEAITAFSWFQSDLYENLKIDSLTRKNEDEFRFRSSKILRESLNGVGESEKMTIKINGIVNNYGEGDIKDLDISLEQVFKKNFGKVEVLKNTFKYRR